MDHHGCVKGYNNLALEFNGKLKGLIAKLNKELPELKLVFADVYNIFLQIITRPSIYGKFGWTYIISFINSSIFASYENNLLPSGIR